MQYDIKIMIVEDDMIIRLDIERALTSQGFNLVATASSGNQALEQSKIHKPDVILMDIGLKGEMNGIEAAKLIQSDQDVKIIFLSGNSDEKTNDKALEVNPYAFVVKPVNVNMLVKLLRSSIQMDGSD